MEPARLRLGVLCVLTLGAGMASFLIAPWSPLGQAPAPAELLRGLFAGGDPVLALVAIELRLPRALLGALVGMSLGIAGCALQSLLRNPLAEPSLVGASGGAALGAVLALYYGLADRFALAVPLAGMGGAGLAMSLLLALAWQDRRAWGHDRLILAGIALESLAAAGVALALSLAPNPFAALEIGLWLLGSLTDRSLQHLGLAAPVMGLGCVLLLSTGRELDLLTLGERTARSLGLHATWLRVRVVAGIALCVGAAVSVAGSIGFVGLAAPHLVRGFIHPLPSRILLASGLAGALLVLVGDIAVRRFPGTGELRLGVVTALLGAPFFLVLLLRRRAVA